MTQLSKTNKPLKDILDFSQGKIERPYVEVTRDIQITIWPEFIDSKSSAIGDLFIWAYHVRIDNHSSNSVRLVKRYWRIIDEHGVVQEVFGDGVIGEQPLIAPHDSYQYSSGVHLRCHSGIMTGHYQMQKDDGEIFDAKIPTFSLDVPTIKQVIN